MLLRLPQQLVSSEAEHLGQQRDAVQRHRHGHGQFHGKGPGQRGRGRHVGQEGRVDWSGGRVVEDVFGQEGMEDRLHGYLYSVMN